jgi:hypothetical protein
MVIFKTTCPFPYGDLHMERVNLKWKTFPFGDFSLNPQMGTETILELVSDRTVLVWKQAGGFVNSPLVIPIWKWGAV